MKDGLVVVQRMMEIGLEFRGTLPMKVGEISSIRNGISIFSSCRNHWILIITKDKRNKYGFHFVW